ncbi:hypothetical protein AS888_06070 [Peribacillus simplex]|uniref:Uncharacterized protein n=1 Tax=Peribacillus simplex TaxID=1478 RepID=A0A109MYF1_9BACI|nr:hypothetical protein AS888_06070 [Peribacillus simplex]
MIVIYFTAEKLIGYPLFSFLKIPFLKVKYKQAAPCHDSRQDHAITEKGPPPFKIQDFEKGRQALGNCHYD